MHKERCEQFKEKLDKLKELDDILNIKEINSENLDDWKVLADFMERLFDELFNYFIRRDYIRWYILADDDDSGLGTIKDAVFRQIKIDTKKRTATFRGIFTISDNHVTYIPKGFIVDGELHIWNSKLKELPEDLRIIGDIHLSDPDAKHLLKQAKRLKATGQISGKIILV
ncbi:hypothetical protein HON36_02540 [Candidatus Parcubacteria bacterium]|jgi:hypothetical protein|nr:hypothetical protein [Candidatus Parcubacteria bacterium]MBT7228671.1 hypothetical protein [Candidatus Parcubacteria bacterium]